MTKYSVILLALSFVTVGPTVRAQHSHTTPSSRRALPASLGRHSASGRHIAAKSTATDLRLLSVADLEYDGTAFVPTDSFMLSYSMLNGGQYNDMEMYWEWNFNLGIGYPYASGTYGAADTRVRQHFNGSFQVDTSWYDEWDGAAAAWANSMRTIFQYDGSGRQVTVTDQSWDATTSAWENYQRQSYTYTTGGNVAKKLVEQWGTSASWDNSAAYYYTWGSTGLRVKDSVQWWSGSTSAWENADRITYSYDGADNRIKQVNEFWGSTAWDTTEIIYSRNFNTHHQPGAVVTTQYFSISSSWDSTHRDNYVYNSYGKPDLYYDETWFPGTGSWILTAASIGTRYHYEVYETTSVGAPATSAVNVSLFPVPAEDQITISASLSAPQALSATITDMAGRTYLSWSAKTNGQYKETIPLNNMPAGNYLLTIHGKDGTLSKQFSVVK